MGRIVFFMVLVSIGFVSCKSSYTRIGDKNANYIPYYLKVYEADSLYLVGDYERSYQILDSLFKKYEPLVMDDYYEYGIYLNASVLSGNTKDINKKIRKGFVDYGGIMTIGKDKRKNYNKVIELADINEDEIKKLKKIYLNNLNLELREQILNIFNSDQEVRKRDHTDEEINKIDKYNALTLEKVINEHGLPPKNVVGSLNSYDLPGGYFRWVVLFLHQSPELQKKYLPILYENVVKGNFEPHHYAALYDRVMLDSIGKQYYGSIECSGYRDCDLVNPKKIDSIRKSVGLPHINYYHWKVEKL